MEMMDITDMADMADMADTSAIQKLEDLLLVAVPRDLTDSDVLRLRRLVLENVRRYHSQWVLLDFSRVDICDSFFGRFIQSTAKMADLMGADVIISGLQDAVVETMVDLGMTLPGVHAVLDLDDALVLSRASRWDGGATEMRSTGQDQAEWAETIGDAADWAEPDAGSPPMDLTEV
jgi:rsbT antagonist protein RsbS